MGEIKAAWREWTEAAEAAAVTAAELLRPDVKSLGDGGCCFLNGCAEMYRVTGDALYRDTVLRMLDLAAGADGFLPEHAAGLGRALFFALDETGEERRRKAIAPPAGPEGRTTGALLYRTEPFRVLYDMRFGGKQQAGAAAERFRGAGGCPRDPDGAGWYLAALIDCTDLTDEQLYEHRRALAELFRAAAKQVKQPDGTEDAGNGELLALYAALKGIRLYLLDGERLEGPVKRAAGLQAERWLKDPEAIRRRPGAAGPVLLILSELLRS